VKLRGVIHGPERAAQPCFYHHLHLVSCSLSYDCPACHAEAPWKEAAESIRFEA
jgi:hypothetical protein